MLTETNKRKHRGIAILFGSILAAAPGAVVRFDLVTGNRFSVTSRLWILLHLYGLFGYFLTYFLLYVAVGAFTVIIGGKTRYAVVAAIAGTVASDMLIPSGLQGLLNWFGVVTICALTLFSLIGASFSRKYLIHANQDRNSGAGNELIPSEGS
jgi:hypothetical protein